jgi:hypothetical protein
MNPNIQELADYLALAKVTTTQSGISQLNEFFKSFDYHPCKPEWDGLDRFTKRELVNRILKTLLESPSKSGING